MKVHKTTSVIIALCLLIVGCIKQPTAAFTLSNESPEEAETVNFNNTSKDGNSYSWEFGDGVTSKDNNPSHAYIRPGDYKIKLKTYSKKEKKNSEMEFTLTVRKSALRLKIEGVWNLNKEYSYGYTISTNSLVGSDSVIILPPSVWKFDKEILYVDASVYDYWSIASANEIYFDHYNYSVTFIGNSKMILKAVSFPSVNNRIEYYWHFSR